MEWNKKPANKVTGTFLSTEKLNSTLLNPWVKEEIKGNLKIFNDNENIYTNLWDATKAVLRNL